MTALFVVNLPNDLGKTLEVSMGGFGSGNYLRGIIKQTVEDGLKLDLCKLIRYKVLNPHYDHTGSITWHRTRDGQKVASIGYSSDFKNKKIHFFYNNNNEPQDYTVQLTTTKPNYGGLRWWFICPLTGKRTAKLYISPGSAIFASRTAHNLNYQSQRESKSQRLIYRAHDLRLKLDKDAKKPSGPIPRRPKGMHRKTYDQIENEIYHLESRGWKLFNEQFSRMLSPR